MNKKTVVCVFGTRPEAIKMVPVIRALQASNWASCKIVVTGQHRELLDQMLAQFKIQVDHDLNLMQQGQNPNDLLAKMLPALGHIFEKESANIILGQGDTTTVLGAALAAFHKAIPYGHIEAGLRTYNLDHPYPEEGYRQMIARITRWHFAPTQRAVNALLAEGIEKEKIYLTGNTCIDTLLQTIEELGAVKQQEGRLLLLTAHRRENFGQPIRNIFSAVRQLAETFNDLSVVYPVHPNPNVKELAHELLGGHPRIHLIEPLDYFAFISLMRQATLILTDSGGIQEEAPALGKPVLILRNTTERPEAVESGVAKIAGTDTKNIIKQVSKLLNDDMAYNTMVKGISPFGDGDAGKRIVDALG